MAKIEIMSKELVKPSVPTPHNNKELKLSFFDQLQFQCYIPVIFFYQNHPDSSSFYSVSCSTTIVDHHVKRSQLLKESLSEVLAVFYPLAGRINNIGNHFSIDCNDSGALFVETRVHSRLTKEAIPIKELNQYLPLEPYTPGGHGVGNSAPILAIKFNSFECGGTAIGVCISHVVADVMSLATFMTSWAAKTRGKDMEIVIPDFHLASDLFPQLGSEEASCIPARTGKPAITAKLVTKRFVFDKEKIAALKEEASSGRLNHPTRVEAVSSFIWKHFIAMSSKSKGKSMFAASHVVNLRPHMNLPRETFAFGNFGIPTAALLVPSGEVDQEYHNLVRHLRTAIKKINRDYININFRSGLAYLCYLRKHYELLAKQEMSSCIFTSCCRFPVYEVDYGWGEPISVCTLGLPNNNHIELLPTRCGEGIEAWVSMFENDVALLPDELLLLANDDIFT